MSLLSGNRKAILRDCLETLDAAATVPERAAAFHRARAELRKTCEDELARWALLGDERQAQELEARARGLASLGRDLTRLVEEATTAEAAAVALEEDLGRLPGERVRSALEARRGVLVQRLREVGEQVQRSQGLGRERDRLDQLRGGLVELQRVVEELLATHTLLRRLSGRPEARDFQAEVRRLEAELRPASVPRGEPVPPVAEAAWFAALETARTLIDQEVNRPLPEKPAELQTARTLIDEALSWATQTASPRGPLEALDAEIQALDSRRIPPTPAQAGAVRDRAQEAVQALERTARLRREELLAELQARRDLLRGAGCATDRVDAVLGELGGAEAHTPARHKRWLSDHARGLEVVDSLAAVNEPTLTGWLRDTQDELCEEVADHLSRQPPASLAEPLRALQAEAEALVEPHQAGPLLDSLAAVAGLRDRLGALASALAEQEGALEEARAALQRRHDALLELVHAHSLPLEDTEADDALMAWAGLGLARRAELLGIFEAHLDRTAQDVKAEGQARLETLHARHAAARRALRELLAQGEAPGPLRQPTEPERSDLAQLFARVAEAREEVSRAESHLAARCLEIVDVELPALRKRMAALDPSRLPEDGKELHTHLLQDLDPQAASLLGRPEDQARALYPLVRRGRELLRRLDAATEQAQARRDALVERLRVFNSEERLRDHCPRVLRLRLEGLIYGIPQPLADVGQALEQLERAEALFLQLELHGRRVAAQALDEAVQALQLRLRGDPGWSAAAEVRRYLDELDELDPHLPVAGDLRQALVRLHGESARA